MLAWAQRVQRLLVRATARLRPAGPARLDLGEHECAPVEGDQVDLAISSAGIALDHGESETLEVSRGERLAETAKRAARVLPRSGSPGAVGLGVGSKVHARER